MYYKMVLIQLSVMHPTETKFTSRQKFDRFRGVYSLCPVNKMFSYRRETALQVR